MENKLFESILNEDMWADLKRAEAKRRRKGQRLLDKVEPIIENLKSKRKWKKYIYKAYIAANPVDNVIVELNTEDQDIAEDIAYEVLNALGRERYSVSTFQMYEGSDDNYDDLDEDYRDLYGLRIVDEG